MLLKFADLHHRDLVEHQARLVSHHLEESVPLPRIGIRRPDFVGHAYARNSEFSVSPPNVGMCLAASVRIGRALNLSPDVRPKLGNLTRGTGEPAGRQFNMSGHSTMSRDIPPLLIHLLRLGQGNIVGWDRLTLRFNHATAP